jgi:hypothetical protein
MEPDTSQVIGVEPEEVIIVDLAVADIEKMEV